MSWTSLDEDGTTSSSDEEEDLAKGDPARRMNRMIENIEKEELQSNHFEVSALSNPLLEQNSDNEILSEKAARSQLEFQTILTSKDEHIRTLQKLVNGQREQLYHFLNMSMKKETLLELKKTCRETEALSQNENMCMALDKFKYDNNLPTEQTLVRKDVSKTLLGLERLMRHQVRLVKAMGLGVIDEDLEGTSNSVQISCLRRENEFTDVQRLSKGTKNIQRKIRMLKIQLKKLALIEEERIDLVERVYSIPPDQRQYYAHLAVIEREKSQLLCEIDKLRENYRNHKQKCCLLEGTDMGLSGNNDSKVLIEGIDQNNIKTGSRTQLELPDMVKRGELSMVAMTKVEKEKLSSDFVKLYNENAEISERLKNFDEVKQERDDLKREIEVLVENCLRLQGEVKALRMASRSNDLLEELRQACLEREQLRTKLDRVTKEGPGVFRIFGETTSKVAEERDQLRLKVAELEEVRAAHIALLDKSEKNPNIVSTLDRDTYKYMSKQLQHLRETEKQRERLVLEISRYKYALLRQEEEVKDLVDTVDKLMDHIKTLRINTDVNPAKGTPEGPEVIAVLNSAEEKRLDMIRNRIRYDTLKTAPPDEATLSESTPEKTTFINSLKVMLEQHLTQI
ncbi:CAP-Gly domain-containing linker protein 1-like [Neodiprion fabricii]|uniref:CAP-Gly domain-containing linker protein 1-like n=1 Tax=Neodiprion fabricii TaxID=2872261 RepID=UPI001ED939BD|nr:CAP-Gly domain-containing linker protein 1-like [Neodiprion fabricii]